jgi:transposase-like protein
MKAAEWAARADALEAEAQLMLAGPLESDPDGPCSHPEEMRKPAPAMGHESRFLCTQCGEVVEGVG